MLAVAMANAIMSSLAGRVIVFRRRQYQHLRIRVLDGKTTLDELLNLGHHK